MMVSVLSVNWLLLLCVVPLWNSCMGMMTIYDYNKVNYQRLESFAEFRNLFLNDDNSVKTNVFLGVSDATCLENLEASPAFVGIQRHGGGNVLHSVSIPKDSFPFQLTDDACAEILFYRIGTSIENPTSAMTDFAHIPLNRWMSLLMRVDGFVVVNSFPFPVELFWHEESAEPISSGVLQPGEGTSMSTFLGHIFSANALQNNEFYPNVEDVDRDLKPAFWNILDFFVVDGSRYVLRPENRLETCEFKSKQDVNSMWMEAGALSCENIYSRLVDFSHNVWYDKRLGLNFVQPQVIRAYSEVGFEHRRLPEETYKWLKDWYVAEQLRKQETESSAGPCMNQHIAPSTMTHITSEYKERLSSDLKEILEDWYGGELMLTSIYGIRKYTNGSVLRMHVDTANTHVVSAIINVDQKIDQEWPLIILDHEHNEHKVNMQPGDMVLYESAKCLHGRPDVMNGEHYDNIFIHYKPVTDWDYSWL